MVLKERTDLLSTLPGALIAWGLPIAAMILAIGIPHPIKTWCRVALNCEMGNPTGVDKTWGSCGAFSVCDGQPTIENCG
ncbi:hypothetical protein PXK31_22170, partial [Phaeobacter gallaeciensis]|nr:hypothetical protein [Phaeobacter gallaeciensis]MDE4109010.1 hypothetical protein [Phaeobacter gallaeciensis]MDE4113479.1 hypothetical protein [Phaeobacter gallaeciensis]MDE4117939.1 hypothetical protein [Phaeobacter gallaeciensis]MDE4122401.1 hypothetical protein [Phaeobacter gallaeciensis]